MDYLWTPWRYRYISQAGEPGECVFCAAANASADDRELLVVHRARHNYVILNRFPYTSGHVMVVPYCHVATLEDLADEALVELIRAGTHSCYLGDREHHHDWGYGCATCPACELRAAGWQQWQVQGRP